MDNGLTLNYKMASKDTILGLGENHRGMNKRGGIYESYCTDDPNHTPDTKYLYGAHNFILINGERPMGLFIDYPGKVTFDIGFTHKDDLSIHVENPDLDLYILKGESLKEIVKNFRGLIGTSYAPPKWAFGYQQSRWSYPDAKAIEKVADNMIANQIPCDAIYMDIDYMERFKDFTIDSDRFPEFGQFVKNIKKKGFRLIPIIDAGVKIESGYDVYEEGVANDYFCLDSEDAPFVAAVWPGKCHFPDFLNPEARRWFGLQYGKLIDQGIEGFWNDMNEPTIFYTERGINEAIKCAKDSENQNLDIYTFFKLKDSFDKIMNNHDDHKGFYHQINQEKICHYDVHNLYGYNMTRAAAEGFKELESNKRFLLFSRASYIGMHRYGGIWTGDNHSWWDHVLLNLKMLPALNMCGFLYTGADTGGFSADADSELIIRWSQLSLFTPLFRNHSIMGSRNQEPYAFDNESINMMRSIIQLRYALIPYLYTTYMQSVLNDDMYFSYLCFEYDDMTSKHTEDQLLLGDSAMIAPIYQANAIGRYVWLPEDMVLWRAKDYLKRAYRVMVKGHHFIEVALDEVPIFIRKNKMIIIGDHAQHVDELNTKHLTVLAFVVDEASYTYYDDDGKSKDYEKGHYTIVSINIVKQDETYIINVAVDGETDLQVIHFDILDEMGKRTEMSWVLKD